MKTLYFKLTLCFFLLLAGNATQGYGPNKNQFKLPGIVLDDMVILSRVQTYL